MTRNEIRQALREVNLTGEVYRGYPLIRMARRDWRIPRITWKTFHSRQDARDWIDDRWIEEYQKELAQFTTV